MRDIIGTRAFASLLLALGLALASCGGAQEPADPTWRPQERTASMATHWWWEPVERPCEENDDCLQGETCHNVRLGTCPGCPRGETAKICVGEEGTSRQAGRSR